MNTRGHQIVLALTIAVCATVAWPALAQDRKDRLINWAHWSGLGGDSGLSDNSTDDSQKVQLLRITPGFWLRDLERHTWGLQLLLPTTLGVNEATFLDGAVEESLTAFSIVPSLEAWIPLSDIVTLRPRAGGL